MNANLANTAVLEPGPRYLRFVALTANAMQENKIVFDTGASNTFVRDESLLQNIQKLSMPLPVKMGNNHIIMAEKMGDLDIGGVHFSNAYLVPKMAHNLLSPQDMEDDQDLVWEVRKRTCKLL